MRVRVQALFYPAFTVELAEPKATPHEAQELVLDYVIYMLTQQNADGFKSVAKSLMTGLSPTMKADRAGYYEFEVGKMDFIVKYDV